MPSRRTFIAASAAIAAFPSAPAMASPADRSSPYDFAAIDARLTRPAKHRQVMAVNRVADGMAVGYMKHTMDAYEVAMGEGPGAMHVAAVFYGRGVVLGLGNSMWKTYRLAENLKRRGDPLSMQAPETHPFADDFATLVKRGSSFFVCDNALADWATFLVTTGGFNDRTIEGVHDELRRHLVPGALLVPAGVAALNAAQEARFTYFQATL